MTDVSESLSNISISVSIDPVDN
ncbi:hypothetical protein LCGC14_2858450, partial [marine sediment metagenome]